MYIFLNYNSYNVTREGKYRVNEKYTSHKYITKSSVIIPFWTSPKSTVLELFKFINRINIYYFAQDPGESY